MAGGQARDLREGLTMQPIPVLIKSLTLLVGMSYVRYILFQG